MYLGVSHVAHVYVYVLVSLKYMHLSTYEDIM